MGQDFSNFVGNAKRIFDTDTVCKGSLYDCVEKEHFLNFLTLFQETKEIPIQDGKPVFLPKNIKPSSIPDSICKVFIPNELYDKDNNWDMYFTPGYYIHKDKHLTLFLKTNMCFASSPTISNSSLSPIFFSIINLFAISILLFNNF